MAGNSSSSDLRGDAPSFSPGQQEHSVSGEIDDWVRRHESPTPSSYAPEPRHYYGQQQYLAQQQYPPISYYWPAHAFYPAQGYHPPPPAAHSYQANTGYIDPMDPFARQFYEIESVRRGGMMQPHNTSNHLNGPFNIHNGSSNTHNDSSNTYNGSVKHGSEATNRNSSKKKGKKGTKGKKYGKEKETEKQKAEGEGANESEQ